MLRFEVCLSMDFTLRPITNARLIDLDRLVLAGINSLVNCHHFFWARSNGWSFSICTWISFIIALSFHCFVPMKSIHLLTQSLTHPLQRTSAGNTFYHQTFLAPLLFPELEQLVFICNSEYNDFKKLPVGTTEKTKRIHAGLPVSLS